MSIDYIAHTHTTVTTWFERQGAKVPPGLNPDTVRRSLYQSRLRFACYFAMRASVDGHIAAAERDTFIAAVMEAPAAIYHDNGTMSPIDWNQIGLDAVEVAR